MSRDRRRPPLVAVDTETSHREWGAVCQIAAAWRGPDGDIRVEERLVRPPPGRQWMFAEIHGIASQDCAGAPALSEVWDREIEPALAGRQIVAHNAEFDRRHIRAQLRQAGRQALPDRRWLCTLNSSRWLWPEYKQNGSGYKLVQLADRLGIPLDPHQAGADAAAALQLAEFLLDDWDGTVAELISGADQAEAERRRNNGWH